MCPAFEHCVLSLPISDTLLGAVLTRDYNRCPRF